MKKFLAFFLAITVVLSMATMFTTVGAVGHDLNGIPSIDYLDFSGTYDESSKQWTGKNQWASRNEDGSLTHTKFTDATLITQGDKTYFPHALYLEDDSYNTDLDIEFKQDGEVLRLTATEDKNGVSKYGPGIAFEISSLRMLNIGKQDDGNAEYIKIRFKNNSPSTKLSIMGTNESLGAGKLDSRIVATFDVEPNSAEWQYIEISMVDAIQNTTGTANWSSFLRKLAIFPFGYNKDNEAVYNDIYYMEIDYVVIGSKDYVKSYQSELEQKELAADSFEWVSKPTKTEYFLGETIDLTGFEANIKYIEDKYPEANVDGNSVSAVYNFDKPDDEPDDADSWTSTITLKYGIYDLKYDVTVYNIESIEFEYETDEETDVTNKEYDRFTVLQAGDFTPEGIKIKVNYAKLDENGKNISAIKEMYEVDIEGADFSKTGELVNGYYEYLVTINYHGKNLYLPVKLIEVNELIVTPVADKADKIYYGTEIDASYFNITCKYTNGLEKSLADSGLSSYLSVSGDTKLTGGETPITFKLENSAYNIYADTTVNVTVQAPIDIKVTLAKKNYDVDDVIAPTMFTVKYTYADGTPATVAQDDPNLIFNYDTSVPGENLTGVVKIGEKSAKFTYTVKEAEFKVEPLVRDGSKVELLASKIPTALIVSLICLAVVLAIVGIWALLKFVFKVDFKNRKRVSLDDIF